MKKISKLIYSFFIVFLIAFIAGYFTRLGINAWYHRAVSSIFTPPNSVFPIVWTVLYTLMALGFYAILLQPPSPQRTEAQALFMSQLLLNAAWCFAFFGQGWLAAAFVLILIMIFLVYKTIKSFERTVSKSSWFLYPYLIWLCYAAFLNLLFVVNNGLIVEF